jgi:hypothetical protein
MKSYSEYTWLQSYFDNDAFWLEDVISWDESFELFLTDYNIFFFLTSPFFINVHFFLDKVTLLTLLVNFLTSLCEIPFHTLVLISSFLNPFIILITKTSLLLFYTTPLS